MFIGDARKLSGGQSSYKSYLTYSPLPPFLPPFSAVPPLSFSKFNCISDFICVGLHGTTRQTTSKQSEDSSQVAYQGIRRMIYTNSSRSVPTGLAELELSLHAIIQALKAGTSQVRLQAEQGLLHVSPQSQGSRRSRDAGAHRPSWSPTRSEHRQERTGRSEVRSRAHLSAELTST